MINLAPWGRCRRKCPADWQAVRCLLGVIAATVIWEGTAVLAQQDTGYPIHLTRVQINKQSSPPAGTPDPYAGKTPIELAKTMLMFSALSIEVADGTCVGVLEPSQQRLSETLELAIDYVPSESKTDLRRRAFELDTSPAERKALGDVNRKAVAEHVASGMDRLGACAIIWSDYNLQEVLAFSALSKHPYRPGR